MMKRNHSTQNSGEFSRRQFLKLAAVTGLLAGCSPVAQPVAGPTSAPPVTPTSVPAVGSVATGRPEVIKFYPDVSSKIVQTHHAGVWNGDRLSPEAIRQMLDASITRLTGLNDAREAWAALFKSTEKIAIKVNAFNNSTIWTHAPLVNAVVASLQEAGLPAEQIFIYDHSSSMFKEAGYEINQEGPGVRCIAESDFTGKWEIINSNFRLSSTLQNCDALINMPVLKSHMLAGLTFALKNHYGTVDGPGGLHHPIDQAIAQLNALAPIKDRTRLVIGDILEANLKYSSSWPYWKPDWTGDSILMSFDPVAHDTVGMQILEQLQGENDATLAPYLRDLATSYLKTAAELGLGTNNLQHMAVEEVKLG
ncbi:MAG: DUF362 domain-containing protein [Anaerolineales bacterium]|nr:DUF362 domain-containing protein [Anaerolineales bacterium]